MAVSGEALQEQGAEVSLLGAAFSLEFSECSIAAAAICARANTLAEGTKTRWDVYVVGDDIQESQEVYYQGFSAQYQNAFTLDGYPIGIGVAQPIDKAVIPATTPSIRSWVFHGGSAAPGRVEETRGDPILVLQLGATILPIASFAKRSDGKCSYVQLGTEMEDDNFYVTTADEGTSRYELVEALRELVDKSHTNGLSITTEKLAIIQAFINRQAEIKREPLAKAYENQLVLSAYDALHKPTVSELTMLREDGTSDKSEFDTKTVIDHCLMDGGRVVSLVLAKHRAGDKQPDDRLELLAVTREDIAINLATMPRTFGSVEFANDESLSSDARDALIRRLLSEVAARPAISRVSVDHSTYLPSRSKEFPVDDSRVLQICRQLGYIGVNEKFESTPGPGHINERRILRELEMFFAYPEGDLPFPKSRALRKSYARIQKIQAPDRQLLDTLQVGERFEERLGEARKCDELLVHYTRRILDGGENLAAKILDQKIGKTRTNLDIEVAVRRQEPLYRLVILGRPEAMTDEPMKATIDLVLNPTKPNLGLTDNQASIFGRPEYVSEIVDIMAHVLELQN